MALTDSWLKKNSGKAIERISVKTDRDGLSVRISKTGKLTFQLRYRHAGKAKRCDLGSYPLLELKDARDDVVRLKSMLEKGHDPKLVLKSEKQKVIQAASFEELYWQWNKSYCIKKKTNHQEILRTFELHVFPELGELPVEDISLQHWLEILEPLAEKIPSIADRVLTNAKQCLKWGLKRKHNEFNVLSDINSKEDLLVTKIPCKRVLDDNEISFLWRAIDGSRMAFKNKVFIKLCLIYGCRNGELRLSKKKHFDFDKKVWTIPSANHKAGNSSGKLNGKALIRPITSEIEGLLKQVFVLSSKSKYVFTNIGTNDVMSNKAPLSLPKNVNNWLRKHLEYEMASWSIHDLRRTARTNFSSLTEWHIAEVMVGHVLPGESMVYDLYKYLPQQLEALEAWHKKLASIIKIQAN